MMKSSGNLIKGFLRLQFGTSIPSNPYLVEVTTKSQQAGVFRWIRRLNGIACK
ncbi:unnamed protein product [Arabidopsis lyrata]|nr:unnamed protein product [Arabidopsis lyrata]